MTFTVKPPPIDPPADDSPSVDPPVTDIGMARRAKVAESENEKLKQQLEEMHELRARHNGGGDLAADHSQHGHDVYRCDARAPGGGRHPLVCLTKDRTVECRSCGATLDAFDVLLQYAHAERMFSYHLTSLRKEVAELKVARDKLVKERSSLKSQVKRKRERRAAPPAEPTAEDRETATKWARELAATMTEKSGK